MRGLMSVGVRHARRAGEKCRTKSIAEASRIPRGVPFAAKRMSTATESASSWSDDRWKSVVVAQEACIRVFSVRRRITVQLSPLFGLQFGLRSLTLDNKTFHRDREGPDFQFTSPGFLAVSSLNISLVFGVGSDSPRLHYY